MHPYPACGPNPAAILKGQIASYYFESLLACRIRESESTYKEELSQRIRIKIKNQNQVGESESSYKGSIKTRIKSENQKIKIRLENLNHIGESESKSKSSQRIRIRIELRTKTSALLGHCSIELATYPAPEVLWFSSESVHDINIGGRHLAMSLKASVTT